MSENAAFLSRRSFLKWSAALSTITATSSLVACSKSEPNPPAEVEEDPGIWVGSPCWNMGSCLENCHNQSLVKDGVIVRHRAAQGEDTPDNPLRKGCLKGRSQRQLLYSDGRLKYPMKRKNWQPGGGENSHGELRGIDEWERITWEEALDYIAGEIERCVKTYGNSSIVEGSRLLNFYGGSTELYGTTSEGNKPIVAYCMTGANMIMEGYAGCFLAGYGNDRFTVMDNTKLIVLFGANPAITKGTTGFYTLQQMKKAGIKFIIIGPDYNNSMVALDAQWIPCRPSTDTAFLLGTAYHMIVNNLQDQEFLDKCCVGFDAEHMPQGADPAENFKDYVLGTYDGIPKTPEWASEICGTEPQVIRDFAIEIATTGPMIFGGLNAAHRTHNGQMLMQAIFTVGWMTGNVGKPGSGVGSACFDGFIGPSLCFQGNDGEQLKSNPLFEFAGPYGGYGYNNAYQDTTSVAIAYDEVWDAVLNKEYTAMGNRGKQPIDIHLYYSIPKFYQGGSWNRLNSVGDSKKGIMAMRSLDFVVSHDISLSSKSKYADIVLPDVSGWESEDGVFRQVPDAEGQFFCPQLIEPLWECKSRRWVERELATRLGIDPDIVYNPSGKQRWYSSVSTAAAMDPATFEVKPIVTFTQEDLDSLGVEGAPQEGFISYSEAVEKGGFQVTRARGDGFSYYAMDNNTKFVTDPSANPAPTETGKLEIYCRKLVDVVEGFGFAHADPIAIYRKPEEGYEDTFTDWNNKIKGNYPLQMVTPHTFRQGHSTDWNIEYTRRAHGDEAVMNSIDAKARNLKKGDTALISSRRGKILRTINVSDWVMPGVVIVWHAHQHDYDDTTDIDREGCDNILTAHRPTGQGAESFNSTNIQVEKWTGEPLTPDYTWPQRVPISEEA